MNDAKQILGVVDPEAEKTALAAIIKGFGDVDGIVARLRPEMFSELHRKLLFTAAVALRNHGFAITTDALITKVREIVATDSRIRNNPVTPRMIEQIWAYSLEGKDPIGSAVTLQHLYPLQGYADGLEGVMAMIAQRKSDEDISKEITRLMADIAIRRFTETQDVYFGWDAPDRIMTTLQKFDRGVAVRFVWPWYAFNFVPRPPGGMMITFGMVDGAGKSATAEAIDRANAAEGYTVFHIATEYQQEFLDLRMIGQLAGISASELTEGRYTPDVWSRLQRGVGYYRERLQTLHYISGSGCTMDEILGKVYAMVERGIKPDLITLDYIQDVAPGKWDRDIITKCNNAVATFHAALKSLNCVGLLISQGNKGAHDILTVDELTRDKLFLGAPATAKSQLTVLGLRRKLTREGQDPVFTDDGRLVVDAGQGHVGEQSSIIEINVDKNTLGASGHTRLWFGRNQIVRDLPLNMLRSYSDISTKFPVESN